MPKPKRDLAAYQRKLGLTFHDPELLDRALTHGSYTHEHLNEPVEDNERLEFLGDAIIDFIAAEWLYARLPDFPEGRLTRLRAGIVRNETLATFATSLGLGEMLLFGKGERDNGGTTRTRNLGGAFEAIAGALYLDQNMDAVRTFVTPYFEPVLERMMSEESDKDAKSRLQEWSQSYLGKTPQYVVTSETGPDHAREFVIEARIDGKVYGVGSGRSKQIAAQQAAKSALEQMTN